MTESGSGPSTGSSWSILVAIRTGSRTVGPCSSAYVASTSATVIWSGVAGPVVGRSSGFVSQARYGRRADRGRGSTRELIGDLDRPPPGRWHSSRGDVLRPLPDRHSKGRGGGTLAGCGSSDEVVGGNGGHRRVPAADGGRAAINRARGRALARVSLSQASVKSDEQGSVRIEKKRHGRSRDDVAVAGTLAAGALVRSMSKRPTRRWRYRGVAA